MESGFTELSPEEIKALESVNEQTVAAEQEAVTQQQAAAQPTPQPTPEVTQPVLEGLGKWMEENVNIPIVDMLDGSRNAEEVARDRAALRQESADLQKEIDETVSIQGEVGTAIIGGAADLVETIGETAELYGDTQRALMARPLEAFGGSIDQKEVPWSESYEWAEWDLGVAENQTAIGGAARNIFSVLIGMKGLQALKVGVGGGQTVASRVGSEALRGAIVDFFMDPGEGNLSNLVQSGPLANPLSAALAQDEDDNQWIRRTKNMLEGGTIGIAVDGLTELYGALRAGKKARNAALEKGASKEEAAEAGADAAYDFVQTKLDLGRAGSSLQAADASINKTARVAEALADSPSVDDPRYIEALKELKSFDANELRRLYNAYGIAEFIPELDVLRNVDTQASLEAIGKGITVKKLPNGDEIQWIITDMTDSLPTSIDPDGTARAFRIDWDIPAGGRLGSSGSKLYKQFGEVARQDLKPGSVVMAEAAEDGYGNIGKSGAQSRLEGSRSANSIEATWKLDNFDAARDAFVAREGATPRDWEVIGPTGRFDYMQKLAEEGVIPKMETPSDTRSIREKLYQRAGLSAPDESGAMYGIVRADANGRKSMVPLDFERNLDEQIADATRYSTKQGELNIDYDPGSAQRKAENDLNSGRPDGSVERLYEPNERASKTSKYDFEDAATTQATRSADPDMPGGSKPTLNEQDFMNFTDVDRLRDYIADVAPNVDLARVAKSLSLQENEYTLRAYQSIADFVTNGNMETLENLRYVDSMNFKGARADGVVVIDVLARDTAEQMLDLATSVLDVNSVNGDVAQQGIQLMRRAEALAKMQKEVSSQGAFNLMDFWKKDPVPQQKASLERSLREIENRFTGIREAFENGTNEDVFKASSELADLARGMVFSGGDPTAITSFWGAIAKVGMRDINTAVINAWLSSPLSQVRNLAGNAFTASMRPLSLSLGKALGGDFTGAGQALSMYDSIFSTMGEGLSVARKSLSRDAPITEGSKMVDYGVDTLKEVEALKKTASTNTERYAANMMGWYHSWANSPWVTWPGKGLQAGDDMFKTMVARMDLRYQAAVEADKLAKSAAEEGASARIPDKDEIYKKLLKEKIGPDGQILDHDLLKTAQEVTFQTPLQGQMKKVADGINSFPVLKQFVPFLQTPWNVTVYGMQHVPYLARFTDEYKQVMKSGTPDQQAIMKGREAIGGMFITTAAFGVATDNVTGNGPADPELRKIWKRTHEPMSIRLPNGKWMSYKSLPGLDVLIPAVADTARVVKMLPEGEGDKLWTQLMYTVASTLTNKAYFQGFQDLSAVFDVQSWRPEAMTEGLVERFGAATLSNQGAMRQLGNALKDGVYEYRSDLDKLLGKMTGGLAGAKTPVYDILTGEQMVTGYEGALNSLNPFRITSKNASPLVGRLAELQYELNDSVLEKVDGIELTPEEQQFVRKNMYAGGDFPAALSNLVNSQSFKTRYKEWEDNKGTVDQVERKQSEWYKDISEIVQFYKKRAVQKLRDDDTDTGINFRSRYDNKGATNTQQVFANSLKPLIDFA